MPVAKKVGRKKAAGKRRAAKEPKARRVSVRAFARALGVSHTAVQKAIASGRLQRSVGRDRRGAFIADPALGRQEWENGAAKPSPTAVAPKLKGGKGNGHAHDVTLVKVQTEVANERARKLRIENELREGKVILTSDAKKEAFEAARITRDNVMNVPDTWIGSCFPPRTSGCPLRRW